MIAHTPFEASQLDRRTDELEQAKLALLRPNRGPRPGRRGRSILRHPVVIAAGVLAGGLIIGRSRVLRGVVATVAIMAARTAAQRLSAQVIGRLRR